MVEQARTPRERAVDSSVGVVDRDVADSESTIRHKLN